MATKQDVFVEIYHNDFGALENGVLLKLGTMDGLSDSQKLAFIQLFAQRRNEFRRDAAGFYTAFSAEQQNKLLGVVDDILAAAEVQLGVRIAEIQARRAILAG